MKSIIIAKTVCIVCALLVVFACAMAIESEMQGFDESGYSEEYICRD